MPITEEEARERILARIPELKKLSEGLSTILKELPVPSLQEFEDMRSGRAPWTAEAYLAALIRNADFLVDEAVTNIEDYSSETGESLKSLFERKGRPPASLERSLRYLVEDRSGIKIPPSKEEELYHDPFKEGKAMVRRIMDLVIGMCTQYRETLE